MPQLTILELHKNCITSLPENFFALCPALAKLTLEQNQLQSLPDGICDHKTLGSLIVHTNQLGALPEGLGTMSSLKVPPNPSPIPIPDPDPDPDPEP